MGALERIVKLLILLVFASVVIYSGLWFYKADIIKRSIKTELEKSKSFAYGTLDFDTVNVKGFPFDFNVEITNLKLSLYQGIAATGEKPKTIQYGLPKLIIESNFAGNLYKIRPEDTIYITNAKQDNARLVLNNPLLTLQFQNNLLANTLGLALNPGFLQSLTYQDQGFTVTADRTNQLVISGKGSSLMLNREKNQGTHLINFNANSSFERGDDFERFNGTKLASKNLSYDISISSQLPNNLQPTGDITFTISKALFKMDNLDFNIDGKVQGPALMLYGPSSVIDLTLTTSDYALLLDNMVQNQWTDEASKAGIIRLLPDIAQNMDDKKLVVTLSHKQGDNNYYLGKITVSEAQAKFNAYVQEEAQKLAPPASIEPSTPTTQH